MQQMPIKMEELLQLGSKGIQPADINHTSVRMESDKYITIRQASGNLTMIDMSNAGGEPERMPMKAEAVIMNPATKVLALSAKVGTKTTLQIFDMQAKSRLLKKHTIHDRHTIAFAYCIKPPPPACIIPGCMGCCCCPCTTTNSLSVAPIDQADSLLTCIWSNRCCCCICACCWKPFPCCIMFGSGCV